MRARRQPAALGRPHRRGDRRAAVASSQRRLERRAGSCSSCATTASRRVLGRTCARARAPISVERRRAPPRPRRGSPSLSSGTTNPPPLAARGRGSRPAPSRTTGVPQAAASSAATDVSSQCGGVRQKTSASAYAANRSVPYSGAGEPHATVGEAARRTGSAARRAARRRGRRPRASCPSSSSGSTDSIRTSRPFQAVDPAEEEQQRLAGSETPITAGTRPSPAVALSIGGSGSGSSRIASGAPAELLVQRAPRARSGRAAARDRRSIGRTSAES